MTATKTRHLLVFIPLHFLILFLGISKIPNADGEEGFVALSLIPLKKSLSHGAKSYDLRERQFCLGPFYEKSGLYEEAQELRRLEIFASGKILRLGNFEQRFLAIGKQSSHGEKEKIIGELDFFQISHFKVPESLGHGIFIDLSREPEIRDVQMNALKSLGRPLEHVEIQGPFEIYMLLIPYDDGSKLLHSKEKGCQGIASLAEFR